jgi:hypothetical protein
MPSNNNRRPGWQARHGGKYDSENNGKIVRLPLPHKRRLNNPPFDQLTRALVIDRHRRGVLPQAVVEALVDLEVGGAP